MSIFGMSYGLMTDLGLMLGVHSPSIFCLVQKVLFVKITFLCTLPFFLGLKTKDEPRTNQGTTKELPNVKKYLTKPEKG